MQLVTGHIPLNEYLYRFKLIKSARCPVCGTGSESVKHFLLYCPGYAHERWLLGKHLKKKNLELTIDNLLGNAEALIPLTNYINSTHRFTYNA